MFSCWYLSGQSTLETYIQTGLENNLALKQKTENYQVSLLKLKEAVSYYYPSISVQARYSIAEGGRVINFPVGDLSNPVYSTLNQLTFSESFPQIENEEINFLRSKEHETKLRAVQPIFNTEIYYNSKIKSKQSELDFVSIDMYKRELVAEIKKAYYNYQKTQEIMKILDKTEEVLLENIRVNEKLYENNKVTIDAVYRSKSELSKLKAKRAEALKSEKIAAAWFNLLLNRDFNTPIDTPEEVMSPKLDVSFDDSKTNALNQREEIKSLQIYQSIADDYLKLNKGYRLPNVSAVIDYGFQGSEYHFTHEDDFVIASLMLSWDIFKGFGNKHKIQQAKAEKEILELKTEEAKENIQLQVIAAWYALEAASEQYTSSEEDEKIARQAFTTVNKKYMEGSANLLEFIDARNNLTNAEINTAIAMYDYLIAYGEYEKAAAIVDFKLYE